MKELPLTGIVRLAGSKSILQRIMLICSLQAMKIELSPASVCEDVSEMAEAIRNIDADVIFTDRTLVIDSSHAHIAANAVNPVYFTASATAFRFWLTRSLVSPAKTIIRISEQLHKRPYISFLTTLEAFGCKVTLSGTDDSAYSHQIEITPASKTLEEITVDGSFSSQFISGLMLIAPILTEGLTIRFSLPPVSVDYINLTALVLQAFGVHCILEQDKVIIPANQPYKVMESIKIEPDMSSAAFFLCLGAFSQAGITLETNTSTKWQPDWHILSILQSMGVSIKETEDKVTAKACELHGIECELSSNPDLVPILTIVALFADSKSTFKNISHLRYKESDRIAGLTNALKLIGADYLFQNDSLTIYPYKKVPKAAFLDTQNDHRLVMAFTLLALHYPQILLTERLSVSKSCPEFEVLLKSLKLGNDNCS